MVIKALSKKIVACVFLVTLMIGLFSVYSSNTVKAASTDKIVLDGGEEGYNKMIGTFTGPINNGRIGDNYKYLGFVSFKDLVDPSYRYLTITYTGNISRLRIQFVHDNLLSSEEFDQFFYWFNRDAIIDSRDKLLVSGNEKEIPVEGKKTTIVIDLLASGIDLIYYNSGFYMHCDLMKQNGNITIHDAFLSKKINKKAPKGTYKEIKGISTMKAYDKNCELLWDKFKKTKYYEVYVNNKYIGHTFNTFYSIPQKIFKKYGKYKITVMAVTSDGYKGKATISYKVKGKANFDKVNLKKPKNVKRRRVKLLWKKVEGISGYQIQYSQDDKFKKSLVKKTTAKANQTSKTIAKLKKNKKYYFRIRGYKNTSRGKVYGKWSSTKKIKIKK